MITNWKQSVLAKFGFVTLILFTIMLYFPPYADAWVGDDYIQFDYIKPFFERPFTAYQLFNPYELTWYYRPLQNLWFLINQLILGYIPVGYYMILLGFHAIAIALIYRVTRQLKFSYFASFVCAGLFAIHGHWVDVVTWLSSVAIVTSGILNLLALSVWISYLKRQSIKKLLLTIIVCISTLLAHEEGLLLAPFLLLLLIVERLEIGHKQGRNRSTLRLRDWRLSKKGWILQEKRKQTIIVSLSELLTFCFLAIVSLGYLYTQLTRENVTIDINDQSGGLLAHLTFANVQAFLQSTLFRFTLIEAVATATGAAQILLLAVFLGLLVMWLWYGNKVVRLGLLWTGLHLALIFMTLWANLPQLYAGRHIYVASIGLVLAIGATIDQITAVSKRTIHIQQKAIPLAKFVIFIAVTTIILLHINVTLKTQQSWLADTQEEKIAQAQVAEMFPTINEEQHFFSFRFPIAPQFMRSVMQVWYDTPLERPGGSLHHLQAHGQATPDYTLFDYVDGQVYDLMPELQDHAETIFVWAKPHTNLIINEDGNSQLLSESTSIKWQVIDDGHKRQLAMPLTPPDEANSWTSRQFTTAVPANSTLQTAVFPQPNTTYRIRIIGNDGTAETLFQFDPATETSWQETAVSLEDYWGENVIIALEVMGDAEEKDTAVFWANPRLVIDR